MLDQYTPKTCSRCNEVKPRSEFGKAKAEGDGLCYHCKECERERARQRKFANPGAVAEYSRRYRAAHPELVRGRCAAYRRAHLGRYRELMAGWRARNPERSREFVRDAWRRAYAADPSKHNKANQKRIWHKRSNGGCATKEQIAARWAMWGGLCYLCGAAATDLDHVIPVSKGGTGWPANMRPICRPCNASKGNRDWRQYVRR